MHKVLIVDDEKYIRDELKYFLDKFDEITVCGECDEGAKAIEMVKKLKPHVVFLDIHLGDLNGLIVARKILDINKNIYIVLATAYDKYAIQGFEINAVDYILKPFTEERIKMTIGRIIKSRKNFEKEISLEKSKRSIDLKKLCVTKNNRLILIDVNRIEFIKSKKGIVKVYTIDGVFNCNNKLKEIEERFMESKFIRTHKSYIVNIDYISEIIPWFNYTYKIRLKNIAYEEIPVSRSYMKNFKKLLKI